MIGRGFSAALMADFSQRGVLDIDLLHTLFSFLNLKVQWGWRMAAIGHFGTHFWQRMPSHSHGVRVLIYSGLGLIERLNWSETWRLQSRIDEIRRP